MNNFKAVLAGAVLWILLATTFFVLSGLPEIANSSHLQTLIAATLTLPYAIIGAYLYYRNKANGHGVLVGLIMSLTALLLDALITVPFFEIPSGGSYQQFYSNPLLWLLVLINVATVYGYWRVRVHLK